MSLLDLLHLENQSFGSLRKFANLIFGDILDHFITKNRDFGHSNGVRKVEAHKFHLIVVEMTDVLLDNFIFAHFDTCTCHIVIK